MRVEGLASGGIVLDTVELGISQETKQLAYHLRAANTPGNLDHVAQAALYGHLVGNTGTVNLWQKDRRAARDSASDWTWHGPTA